MNYCETGIKDREIIECVSSCDGAGDDCESLSLDLKGGGVALTLTMKAESTENGMVGGMYKWVSVDNRKVKQGMAHFLLDF